MKSCLSVLALALSFNAFSQTVCGTAAENGSVTLTAPAGKVFTTVTFASYGTPNGACGSFTIGGCNAANSKTIVEGILLGQNTATINATNGVFGDPCGGTVKRLYIEAVYSFPLPLSLASFSCTTNGNSNKLQWQTSNEINTQAFDVERSADGIHFSTVGTVTAANNSNTTAYVFTDAIASEQVFFYRLKMIDLNGNFSYSTIIKVGTGSSAKLNIFPNPATNEVSVSGLDGKGSLEILNLQGVRLKQIAVTGNAQIISLANYNPGIYILKYTTGENTVFQKIVKQ